MVRGDELEAGLIEADARRFRRRFDDWDRYGISAFLAIDETEILALCESRLERFPAVLVYRRDDLERLGIEVVPTFRTPHVTLAHPDLESLIRVLSICEHLEITNPHFDG